MVADESVRGVGTCPLLGVRRRLHRKAGMRRAWWIGGRIPHAWEPSLPRGDRVSAALSSEVFLATDGARGTASAGQRQPIFPGGWRPPAWNSAAHREAGMPAADRGEVVRSLSQASGPSRGARSVLRDPAVLRRCRSPAFLRLAPWALPEKRFFPRGAAAAHRWKR